MARRGSLELRPELLGALPVINHFLARLRVPQLLDRYVPCTDARLRLCPAATLGVLIRNLAIERRPVYAVGEWAAQFAPDALGLAPGDVRLINDDRMGRMLDRLFAADRASLVTELALRTVSEFGIDVGRLHNDSTTITLQGTYARQSPTRRGKAVPQIAHGHNKDHRPDLKQLLWILTVSSDGAVPLAYRSASGNTEDSLTHVATWDGLVDLVGHPRFVYVADSKLCTKEAMGHIAAGGGRFVTVLPKSRKEEAFFRHWLQTHTPKWEVVLTRPGDPERTWRATESPVPSAEGYRIVWIHSSAKADADQNARISRIDAGIRALDALQERLARPRARFRSAEAVHAAADAALSKAGARRWIDFEVSQRTEEHFHKISPARRTYRRYVITRFEIKWWVKADIVAYDARSDGCFPLITNDWSIPAADLLAAHKFQPNLEKRFAQLKGGSLDVTPMWLKDPARIDALLLCEYIAQLAHALIERQIRMAMASEGIAELPLYPEQRACRAPTAARMLEVFAGMHRDTLFENGQLVTVFEPCVTPLQSQLLRLLGLPPI